MGKNKYSGLLKYQTSGLKGIWIFCHHAYMFTLWDCSPKLSIDSLISSPDYKYVGGFMPIPTPDGVPVVIISPGCKDIKLLRYESR